MGMAATRQPQQADQVERWFERRSYDHARYSDVDSLIARKQELEVTVTAILPARRVAATIGPVLDALHGLNRRAPLLDQIVVVDARSDDGTAEIARVHGAELHFEDELLPRLGPVLGKGDAMWRALSVARGDLVLYLDSDSSDFRPHFVSGLLGPLLSEESGKAGVRFVKGLYSRPWTDGRQVSPDGGARVTELTAKPLLNLHFPELAGFAQPLAGEVAATRELLCSIPFLTGYAVEIGMLIDVLERAGLDAMAQVDLGSRSNRNQPLFALGKMAFAVLRAVELRRAGAGPVSDSNRHGGVGDVDRHGAAVDADRHGAAVDAEQYVHAIRSVDDLRLERSRVELVERPPMATVLDGGARG